MNDDRIRAFLAVSMPAPAIARLHRLQEDLKPELLELSEVNWPRSEGLHVTLRFLGEVTPSRARAVGRAMDEVAALHPPFEMDLARLGAFPQKHRARVLWVGLRGGSEKLCRMQRDLESRMLQLGFSRESHEFEPHLTVARLRTQSNVYSVFESRKDFSIPAVAVTQVHLMKSYQSSSGPAYEAVHTSPLR